MYWRASTRWGNFTATRTSSSSGLVRIIVWWKERVQIVTLHSKSHSKLALIIPFMQCCTPQPYCSGSSMRWIDGVPKDRYMSGNREYASCMAHSFHVSTPMCYLMEMQWKHRHHQNIRSIFMPPVTSAVVIIELHLHSDMYHYLSIILRPSYWHRISRKKFNCSCLMSQPTHHAA